ncbi:GNAT family N-acetyltransferase [Gleimia hominis]|uniref:GNAT family N-acetyltransferase n=1 Tax=Gleimia hominis TaxID=595468 RepID=UPI0011AF5767|nr:GNAT family N-acetyltransferase [Gleimia hominis]WIK64928.1 GNAT family N-acetyltransferase [Gleimia hominis]
MASIVMGNEVNVKLGARPDRGVRAAQPGDGAFMAQLQAQGMARSLQRGLEQVAAKPEMFDVRAMTQVWEQSIRATSQPGQRILVATHEGEAVGFAAVASGETVKGGQGEEIIAFEVAAERLDEGHAERLMAAVTDLAQEDGATHVSMWVVADDEPRTEFLESCGFGPSGGKRTLQIGVEKVGQHLWWAGLEKKVENKRETP